MTARVFKHVPAGAHTIPVVTVPVTAPAHGSMTWTRVVQLLAALAIPGAELLEILQQLGAGALSVVATTVVMTMVWIPR